MHDVFYVRNAPKKHLNAQNIGLAPQRGMDPVRGRSFVSKGKFNREEKCNDFSSRYALMPLADGEMYAVSNKTSTILRNNNLLRRKYILRAHKQICETRSRKTLVQGTYGPTCLLL